MGRQITLAILRLAGTWGIAWSAIFTAIGVAYWLSSFSRVAALMHQPFGLFILRVAVRGFVLGAIAGFVFALLIAITERRRTVGSLKMWRIAFWGAVGGIVLAGVMLALIPISQMLTSVLDLLTYAAVSGGLGAGSAVTSLGVARRARIKTEENAVLIRAP